MVYTDKLDENNSSFHTRSYNGSRQQRVLALGLCYFCGGVIEYKNEPNLASCPKFTVRSAH